MPFIKTKDDTRLFYRDWGSGQPVVFSHGWPQTGDAFEDQMLFLGSKGFRCIAFDRRGHGRSDQPWDGYDYDTFADDLNAIVCELDLTDVIHVGHGMGGGEIVRYIARYGTERAVKIVLISTLLPRMLRSAANLHGKTLSELDEMRSRVIADRSQFLKDIAGRYYGADDEGRGVSQGLKDAFWQQGMQACLKAVHGSITAFSETDFTQDLQGLHIPTLILHGSNDQISSAEASAVQAAELVADATLKIYQGGGHGICSTQKDHINSDLLFFMSATPG